MKINSNRITLIYFVILIAVVFLTQKIFTTYSLTNETNLIFTNKEIVIILLSIVLFRYFLYANEKHNKSVLNKLKKSNQDIIESKERYDIVAKATSDTIWDWKIDDDAFIWNKGIQGVFGYKKEDVGKNSNWWFERIHPEDSLKMSVRLYSFLDYKTDKWQDEYRFQCADGSYKYVIDKGFLVKDDKGKIIRMIGAIQDVTKQKEEEQRLRLLETVITKSNDAVMICGIKLNENSLPSIVFVNSAFEDMTGYKTSEAIGMPLDIIFGAKSDSKQIDLLKQKIKEYQICDIETVCYKKDNTLFWINFTMIPVTNKDGEHSHWISVQRDVTELKEKEKEREQLIRELTKNNNDLKQFSYITSHNLRAPLSNLTGLLNLIDDIPIENPDLKELIDGFSTSTHLLNETINDLVKVIIIKDNPAIEKERILIKDIFENVFNQLNFLINLHKPILKIELSEEYISNINKSYLESIFLNLMTNSIKYRSATNQLKITITSKVINEELVISFKDNGIGIDMGRNKDKIFGLYQRFHNHPDSKGLGLYLVKSQVESMGGNISVESKLGKGTTFTLNFKNI
ncbi:PAS domain S-box protein [Flavobacterium macrobrachii]|jgi:PAS domain S-box-containing protein|uniref:histidine kinase n=1 Tax=Flavobacterium macrobrachii TaxID=591204 RepID=A0ABS2CZU1_9FLAO|nr:PAS domain S-box protein [Flavobacterium macrobrachii]PZO28649.1 MAG: PAS domain-containing sensor histidine kinase [Flavobacteriaceae bacterium]